MSNQVLTQEELQQIQQTRKQMLEVASALGELGYQQVLIDLEKAKLTEIVKTLRDGERALLEEFNKKYGEGLINLETGEIQTKP